jgi:hypothetical protein
LGKIAHLKPSENYQKTTSKTTHAKKSSNHAGFTAYVLGSSPVRVTNIYGVESDCFSPHLFIFRNFLALKVER